MNPAVFCSALVLTGVLMASAQAQSRKRMDLEDAAVTRFVAIVESNGCRMSWSQAGDLVGSRGFTELEARSIVDLLKNARLAFLPENTEMLELYTPDCIAPARREAFRKMIVAAGCQVNGDRPPESMRIAGFTPGEARALGHELRQAGLAELDVTTNTLKLTTEECG